MYCVMVKGRKIRIAARFLRAKTTEYPLGDPFFTSLTWAYVFARRVDGTVVDDKGQLAPAIRHAAKIELWDYQPNESDLKGGE